MIRLRGKVELKEPVEVVVDRSSRRRVRVELGCLLLRLQTPVWRAVKVLIPELVRYLAVFLYLTGMYACEVCALTSKP